VGWIVLQLSLFQSLHDAQFVFLLLNFTLRETFGVSHVSPDSMMMMMTTLCLFSEQG